MKVDRNRSGIFERFGGAWIHAIDQHIIFMIFIDPERFINERSRARTIEEQTCPDQEKSFSEFRLGWSDTFGSLIRLIKIKRWNMFWLVANVLFALFDIYKCIIFAIFEPTRDPITRLYVNSYLRSFEGPIMYDIMRFMEHSKQVNRLMLLVHMSHLFIKYQANKSLIKSEIINRHEYTRVNSIQFLIVYLCNITNSPKDWIKFFTLALKHKCDLDSPAAQRQSLRMEKLNELTRDLSRLDRYYYYNHFDFTHCFKGIPLSLYRKDCGAPVRSCDNARNVPMAAGFLPRPIHRVDPTEVCYLVMLSIASQIVLLFIFFLTMSIILHSHYVYPYNWTFGNYMYSAIHGFLLTYMLIWNVAHISLLMIISFSYLSRTRRLCDLLMNLHNQIQTQQHLIFGYPSSSSVSSTINRLGPYYTSSYSDAMESSSQQITFHYRYISDRLEKFRLRCGQKLHHLIDLIEVLRVELDDIREMQTVYMNIYFISGTVMLAMSSWIIQISESLFDQIIILIMCLIVVTPMLYSLISGALIERMVSTVVISIISTHFTDI